MIILRKADERGHHREEWLDSRHTFSFHTYHDPAHMGFRDLRVINEDRVAPGGGFGMHPHRDMEIFSLVLRGALEHRDDLGNREVVGPWHIQKITAGSGIRHSEANPSAEQEVHFLQVWILPEGSGLEPAYQTGDFSRSPAGQLVPILTPDARDGSVRLRQDASVFLGRLPGGTSLVHRLATGRQAWVQLLSGALLLNGEHLLAGDGAAAKEEEHLILETPQGAELLLFDLR